MTDLQYIYRMITLFSISTCITIHNPKLSLTETPEHEHERRARCKATTYCYQYLTKHRDKLQITTRRKRWCANSHCSVSRHGRQPNDYPNISLCGVFHCCLLF